MQINQSDYIFLGAGCATLSLVNRMIKSGKFSDSKILIIDKDKKITNDRTWCFWEKEPGFFEEIVHCSWKNLKFKTDREIIDLDIAPYEYKMIRGIDFYKYSFELIEQQSNIEFLNCPVSFNKDNNTVSIDNEILTTTKGTTVFNSIYTPSPNNDNVHSLLQHFKGYLIETDTDSFDENEATLMDFSISQKHGTTFMYVLPLSKRKALVEYTLFTKSLLSPRQYDEGLAHYLQHSLHLTSYRIIDEEFGVIPMTNKIFPFFDGAKYNIGSAGGQTKPSTGYTFSFIQRQSDEILQKILSGQLISRTDSGFTRFHFYDSTFLNILSNQKLEGKEIFYDLFKKNKAAQVLKFLDDATSLSEEIRILATLPKWPFIKAGAAEMAIILSRLLKRNHINSVKAGVS